MTNLEWLNEIGMITTNRVAPNGKLTGVNLVIALRDDDFKKYSEKGFDWLLSEHKEPIKLKKWEYDLLTIFENHTDSVKLTLDNAIIISPMLRAGYFKGVHNTSMTIQEILDNCEVIE